MSQQTVNEKIRREMLETSMGRLLFMKAYPTVIIQLITVIYNTADTYFVAKISTEASAGVGIVFSLMAIIQAVGFGIGMGASSLISRRLGEQRNREADVYASSGAFAGLVLGAILCVVGLLQIDNIMRLIGATQEVLPHARAYGFYILIAAPFMCLSFVINNILKAEGQSFLAMVGMTTGGILNMVLDPVFIFGLRMGTAGAAVATMISQIVGLLIMLSFFAGGKSILHLTPRNVSREMKVYASIFRTGLPTIFRQGMASLSSAILNVQASGYGAAAVAAIAIANKVYMLVRNIVLGIGQGYQPIAGYCYGAGDKKRVRDAFKLATIAATLFCLAATAGVLTMRVPLMGWFRADDQVIAIGSRALSWFCLSMPLLAYSTFVNQTYQCLGFAGPATFLACCRQGIFFVPLAFILPHLLGLTGIEMLQACADILTFVVSVPFMIHFRKKHLTE